ncbi:hypothetical protein Neosp_015115 [[Neocosmospora] mangrovei]
MGKVTGDSDSQRQFNGVFLEDLRKHTSHRMRWLPGDRAKMLQWLAEGRHSIDTIRDDQESLSRLATSIGIARDKLHKRHRAVLKTKLLSSLTYTLTTLLAKGEVTEYWDPATNSRRLRWPDDLVDEYKGNGSASLAATVEQVDDAEATRARQATDKEAPNPTNVVIEIFDDDDDFVDSEGDIQMSLVEPSVAQTDDENNGRNTNDQIGWDQNQVNEAIRQSLQDQQRSQWPWGVNHQQQANQQPPLGWTPLLGQGLQLPSPPGAPLGFQAPLSQLPVGDPMNAEPQIPPELQRVIDENQLKATRLDQYRVWLEGESANMAVRDQEVIRQFQSIAQERLKLEQDKRQEDARVRTVENHNDFEAKAQKDRADILKQQREEHDRAMADMRRRREGLEAEESALEARSRGYQVKLEEVALAKRQLEAENERYTDQRRVMLQEQSEEQTMIEQQQAELERQRAEIEQQQAELAQQQQQRQQQEEQQTTLQHQPPQATVQTAALPPPPLSLLGPYRQRSRSLRGSVFWPQQPESDSLEEARKRLEALLSRPPPSDTQSEPHPVQSGGPGAALADKMAEMPLSRPAPPQNTFSVPDTLSVSDAESVRSVAEGDDGLATPKPSPAPRFKTPPLWPWQPSGHDLGTHGLDDWYIRPGFDHGNFDQVQAQSICSDDHELDTVSVVGPSWSLLDALDKARQDRPEYEASSSRLGSFAYGQPKDVALGPSTTILEALQNNNSQSPVPSFA